MRTSWDFWDTLVTRCVLRPWHVFDVIEERAKLPGFASERINAERLSRSGVVETTIDRIYEFIPYDDSVRRVLKSIEIDCEKKLATSICSNIDRLNNEDIIISDMYLPSSFYADLLNNLGMNIELEKILVSCDHSKTKHSGDLYRFATEKFGEISHCGDNIFSDYDVPRRLGMCAEHFSSAEVSIYEQRLESFGGDAKYLAGLIRASRLFYSERNGSINRWRVFCGIVAPLLVQYVEWIINECNKKNIKTIFFLSRDGEILSRIAERIVKARGLDVGIRYLFASRQALHLPAHVSIEESQDWILADTDILTIRIVAERCGIKTCDVVAIFDDFFPGVRLDDNLSSANRKLLPNAIADERFIALLENASLRAFKSAEGYLLQQGLLGYSERHVAIVDVGWNGRIQRSLDRISKKSNSSFRIHGYYLALANSCRYEDRERVNCFLFNPFKGSREDNWINSYQGMVEFFLKAAHPQVLGYVKKDGAKFCPNFSSEYSGGVLRDDHVAIMVFVDRYLALTDLIGRPLIAIERFAINEFRRLLTRPRPTEVDCFLCDSHSEQQDDSVPISLVNRVRINDILFNKSRWAVGVWVEGSIALYSYSWSFIFISLYSARHRIRNLLMKRI